MQTASPVLPDSEIEDLVRTHFGLEGTAEWLWGEKDSNHRLTLGDKRTVLVKVLNPGEPPSTTDMHSRALLHVARADPGIPVQRIVPASNGAPDIRIPGPEGNTRAVRVVTFLPGQALSGATHSVAQRYNIGLMMARMQQALASFEHASASHKLTWDMTYSLDLRGVCNCLGEGEERAALTQCLDLFQDEVLPRLTQLPSQVIHNDFNSENILVDPADTDRVSGIIDFGDMVRAPRVFDVAVGASYILDDESEPVESVFDFLKGYASLARLTRPEIEVLYPCLLARLVMRLAIPSWRATLFPNQAERLLRKHDLVRRTLARVRAYRQQAFTEQSAAVFQRVSQ
ncbi:Ser/Thr protein kinase RdoA (MazF antagonist) [Breoghania corrubedonensis]|uniref:Hydroxylysine kinase n=1 Tax=Breoghania corrubedonensis TaxID=665038 RepID=A0A2T5V5G3_9HYPH|nr:Ser/Thr protein kinase RdoA (MazF antagonist) [Breoghania corrubedonensis]